MKGLPSPPDSVAVKFALMPARIKFWREQGFDKMADRLQAEFEDAVPADVREQMLEARK